MEDDYRINKKPKIGNRIGLVEIHNSSEDYEVRTLLINYLLGISSRVHTLEESLRPRVKEFGGAIKL